MLKMQKFALTVNGAQREVTAHPDTPLLWVLRDLLNLPAGVGLSVAVGDGVPHSHQNQAIQHTQDTANGAIKDKRASVVDRVARVGPSLS